MDLSLHIVKKAEKESLKKTGFFQGLDRRRQIIPLRGLEAVSGGEGEGFGFKAFCPRDCRTDAPQRPTDAAGLSYRISGRGDL